MFNLGNNKTKIIVKGYNEGKRILELEMESFEQAELFISRMKSQRFTSIRDAITNEYGRFFINKVDLEIDPIEDEVRYFLNLGKYKG